MISSPNFGGHMKERQHSSVSILFCCWQNYPWPLWAELAQYWERFPSTTMPGDRVPYSETPYVGGVDWIFILLWEVFLRILRFSPLLKKSLWFDFIWSALNSPFRQNWSRGKKLVHATVWCARNVTDANPMASAATADETGDFILFFPSLRWHRYANL